MIFLFDIFGPKYYVSQYFLRLNRTPAALHSATLGQNTVTYEINTSSETPSILFK